MASIIGEKKKWHNASEADISAVDALISAKSSELNHVTSLYSQAMTGIALCDNKSWGCVSKSGRHISTWRDWRDLYGPMMERYKKELQELQDRRAALVKAINDTATAGQLVAQSSVATAEAAAAIAEAETVQATAKASKIGIYALIAGVAVVIIIGGIFAYKMYKKK